METQDSARYEMYVQLVDLISGGKVVFCLEKPKVFNHGETARDRLGDTVIRVDPSLSPENFYTVFLHELAHIFLKHIEAEKSLSNSVQIEHDAQRLANMWANIAKGTAKTNNNNSIERRLLRLLNHFRQSKIKELECQQKV